MSNTITAKTTISILRGERARILAQAKVDATTASRLARASGNDPTEAASAVTEAAQRVVDALEYAEASVFAFKAQGRRGKSGLKAGLAAGFTSKKRPTDESAVEAPSRY